MNRKTTYVKRKARAFARAFLFAGRAREVEKFNTDIKDIKIAIDIIE